MRYEPRTDPPTVPADQRRQTERWFVRQGTPTMIERYGFVDDVLPRMVLVLVLVGAAGLAWPVVLGGAGPWGWPSLAVVVGAALVVGLRAAAHLRRYPRFSPAASVMIVAGYAATPVAASLLLPTRAPGPAVLTATFACAFALTWLVTTFGIGTLLRRAIRHTVYDLRNSVQLLGRALPVMLFVTLFLFFTAELWQAMSRVGWGRLGLVVVLFGAVTVLAAAGRLRDEIGRVEQDLSRPRLAAACQDTPLARLSFEEIAPLGHLRPVPLTGTQERNLLLVLATRQLVQVAVVGLALFGFFVVLGLLLVEPETAAQWIGTAPDKVERVLGMPVVMLRNSVLFAAFGSMYFVIRSMSDTDHRAQFFAGIVDDVERILAVRAVYLAVRTDDDETS